MPWKTPRNAKPVVLDLDNFVVIPESVATAKKAKDAKRNELDDALLSPQAVAQRRNLALRAVTIAELEKAVI